MGEHCYATALKDVSPGRPFLMVNYKGAYIKVVCEEHKDHKLSAADHYSLIVELASGKAFYMANEKPCFLYPGEER
jgi:hypothetical protein